MSAVSGEEIAAFIKDMKAEGAPAKDIAVVMGMSVRTMQRWLQPRYGRLTDDERSWVIQGAHDRHHAGMSVRQIVADFASKGEPRMAMSVGWVHRALTQWRCSHCSNAPGGAHEQTETAVAPVQSRHLSQVNGGAS